MTRNFQSPPAVGTRVLDQLQGPLGEYGRVVEVYPNGNTVVYTTESDGVRVLADWRDLEVPTEESHECDNEDCQRCFHLAPLGLSPSSEYGAVPVKTPASPTVEDLKSLLSELKATLPPEALCEQYKGDEATHIGERGKMYAEWQRLHRNINKILRP